LLLVQRESLRFLRTTSWCWEALLVVVVVLGAWPGGGGRGLAPPGSGGGPGQGAVDDGADGLGALALQEGAMVALHHVDRHRAVAHLQAGGEDTGRFSPHSSTSTYTLVFYCTQILFKIPQYTSVLNLFKS